LRHIKKLGLSRGLQRKLKLKFESRKTNKKVMALGDSNPFLGLDAETVFEFL
jgi:hypothetical protein